ncbi:MAG: FUSC family protein [Proteobacteria bacterium]|nr:FUSC family protein [Pseudomonadota bacterium]
MMAGWHDRLMRLPWLQKAIRTVLAVSPGLGWWAAAGNSLGVAFAFAALCLSVTYGDKALRPRHLAALAFIAAAALPGMTWLEAHPLPCVPATMALLALNVVVRRRTSVPTRVSNWLLIYLLYQSSELSAEGVRASLPPGLLMLPAALWTWLVCFVLWPHRGAEPPGAPQGPPSPAMGVGRHALCAALAGGVATTAAFLVPGTRVNWVVWSAMTVTQAGTRDSLVKSRQRIIGAAIGCVSGYAALVGLGGVPALRDTMTALLVSVMVAPETYVLAVAIRSALAILGGAALGGDGAAAGLARIGSIALGVGCATAFLLAFAPRGWWRRGAAAEGGPATPPS